MSGSVYGNWPLATSQLELAKKQAKLVGCTDDTSSGIVKCLKDKSSDEISHSFEGLRVSNLLLLYLLLNHLVIRPSDYFVGFSIN